jgi:hypothetical protein
MPEEVSAAVAESRGSRTKGLSCAERCFKVDVMANGPLSEGTGRNQELMSTSLLNCSASARLVPCCCGSFLLHA